MNKFKTLRAWIRVAVCAQCDDKLALDALARKLGWSEAVNEPPWSFVESVLERSQALCARTLAALGRRACDPEELVTAECEAQELREHLQRLVDSVRKFAPTDVIHALADQAACYLESK